MMVNRGKFAVIAAIVLLMSLLAGSGRAEPSPDEAMRARDEWIHQHLSGVEPTVLGDRQNRQSAGVVDWTASRSGEPPFTFRFGGRSSRDLLSAWNRQEVTRQLDDRRIEHRLTWTDPKTGLQVALTMIEYADHPAVEWLLHFTNTGQADTPIIESIQPLDIQIENTAGAVLNYALGDSNSADSFRPVAEPLGPQAATPRVIAPTGGRSSEGHMPYFNVDRGNSGVAIAVGWAGQWRAEFVQSEDGFLRAAAGQELTHFVLHPGETVRTPRILMAFWNGTGDLCGNNVLRRVILAHYLPQRDGRPRFTPICASHSETAPDGTYEQPHLAVMPVFKPRGIEVFWFDMNPQHWYGDFPTATGTWEPDPKRLPNGLGPLGQAAHEGGLEFLLWFEPERVHPGTKIDREHPEWVMRAQGEWSQLFRLHDEQARKWLTDHIDKQVTEGRVDWIRWDFNIGPLGFWRRNDTPDRQGITEIRHVEGLYAMWSELQRRHPGLLIDICASGGRRLDFETCSYGMPLWHSDLQCAGSNPAADQLQNSGLWRWVPMHACGVFDLEPTYAFRSAMTTGNILAASRNNRAAVSEPGSEAEIKRTVAIFTKLRPYMLGDFYPLFPHDASEATWYGYQFHRPDSGTGMAMLFRRSQCEEAEQTLALRGIDPKARYEVSFEDTPAVHTVMGDELAHYTVSVPSAPGSAIVYYRRSMNASAPSDAALLDKQ
ncbi:MAG TPA: hypothetical protein DD670_00165 [Planctomycetaceae bacterium]|nr:hypothetical protein [Planctomycetaceae bacterium]